VSSATTVALGTKGTTMLPRSIRPLLVSLLLLGLLAPAALAAPPETDRGRTQTEEVVEDYCGLTLIESLDATGLFLANQRGPDQVWFGSFRAHGTYTLLNPENGRWMQLRFNFVDKDLQVQPHGDGTATLTVLVAGRSAWTTSDGVRLANSGLELFEVLYDYETDEFTVVSDLKTAGRFQLHGGDFCTLVQRHLG
jgi:hypothetical protein